MKDGKPNKHDGPCARCGQTVPAGEGVLERVERDGRWAWVVAHRGECDASPGAGVSELPRWAVYGPGVTPAGNPCHGVRFVDSATVPDDGDPVPVNEAARAALAAALRNRIATEEAK